MFFLELVEKLVFGDKGEYQDPSKYRGVLKIRRHARFGGILEGYLGDIWRTFGGYLDDLCRKIVGNLEDARGKLEGKNLVFKILIFLYPSF